MEGTRHVTGFELRQLADVDDERCVGATSGQPRGEGTQIDSLAGLDRAPGSPPCLEAAEAGHDPTAGRPAAGHDPTAGDLARQAIEADPEGLAREIVQIGWSIDEQDDRRVRVDDPAEPGTERDSGRDGQ